MNAYFPFPFGCYCCMLLVYAGLHYSNTNNKFHSNVYQTKPTWLFQADILEHISGTINLDRCQSS